MSNITSDAAKHATKTQQQLSETVKYLNMKKAKEPLTSLKEQIQNNLDIAASAYFS